MDEIMEGNDADDLINDDGDDDGDDGQDCTY